MKLYGDRFLNKERCYYEREKNKLATFDSCLMIESFYSFLFSIKVL